MNHEAKRARPRHPRIGATLSRFMLPFIERVCAHAHFHRITDAVGLERLRMVREKLERGELVYLAGISSGGVHNSGVALVEVSAEHGPRLICNHEEERFSGIKHSNAYPRHAIDALLRTMKQCGLGGEHIDAWVGTFDVPAGAALLLRTFAEELPGSICLLMPGASLVPHPGKGPGIGAIRAASRISGQLGLDAPVAFIGIPHHDNHACFSFSVSPFARVESPVMIAVLDAMGDTGAISLYVAEQGRLRNVRQNQSVFDSLGFFYTIISSTQGGWTGMSSEGRYMGAAAFGNGNRRTNPYYAPLRQIFSLEPYGQVYLNRALANWPSGGARKPYTPELVRILGKPIPPAELWNPDAVLSLEKRQPNTPQRLDKAAATQMVLEDALFHVIEHLIRETGSDRLILTGGIALNAVANMRLLDRFDEAFYIATHARNTRLHLWVPPVPGDAGVTIGAAYMFSYLAGAGLGPPLDHAFYCGFAPAVADIRAALDRAPDIAWIDLGDAANVERRNQIADFMAFMTARNAVFAIFQGVAETGPRALGHRSIVANPCNPRTRDVLNERVKHREAFRPLAPMLTLQAAQELFELSDGASDDNYNAYNYMVLTARAKPEALRRIPAVIHADGTGRLQIVREHVDPVTYAYLKALGRRIGVEAAVNTSFNVAGPIVQTATQALDTLRRSKGMDGVLMFADEGPVFAAWKADTRLSDGNDRLRKWLVEWQAEHLANLVS
jgi:carbamoyltransferase